jgi:hypothetical protein
VLVAGELDVFLQLVTRPKDRRAGPGNPKPIAGVPPGSARPSCGQVSSVGTRSDPGRDCRDAFPGLRKTCAKLGLTFWDYLGARPGTDPVFGAIVEHRAARIR